MSVKHVKDYYEKIANQYFGMVEDLKDFEELAQEGMYSPEKIEKIKTSLIPIKANYERISYIVYLLNMPNKKDKARKYKKIEPVEGSLNEVLNENKSVLDSLKKLKEEK